MDMCASTLLSILYEGSLYQNGGVWQAMHHLALNTPGAKVTNTIGYSMLHL